MKEVDLAAVLKRNPAARRDAKTIRAAQAAIKKRRKAGFLGKTYDLEPANGGTKRGLTQSGPTRLTFTKVTFPA